MDFLQKFLYPMQINQDKKELASRSPMIGPYHLSSFPCCCSNTCPINAKENNGVNKPGLLQQLCPLLTKHVKELTKT